MRKHKIYCPGVELDCPYYRKGECGIENPAEECDDFMYFADEMEDYISRTEKRRAFERGGNQA